MYVHIYIYIHIYTLGADPGADLQKKQQNAIHTKGADPSADPPIKEKNKQNKTKTQHKTTIKARNSAGQPT